jgi:poly(A) polymerase
MMLSRRMDELEARIDELAAQEQLAAMRPELDGLAVMTLLDLKPGRDVGRALDFLMEVRLEEGLLGEEEITRRLRDWWLTQSA